MLIRTLSLHILSFCITNSNNTFHLLILKQSDQRTKSQPLPAQTHHRNTHNSKSNMH